MNPRSLTPPLVALTLTACATTAPPPPAANESDGDHRAQVEQWRSGRVERLTRDTGWLTLAGLHTLKPGEQTVGSDRGADVVLPPSVPASVGTLVLTNGGVTLDLADGVEVSSGGEPWHSGPMAPDVSGEPTILEIGTVNFFVIERGDVVLLRVRDRAHPARDGFEGLDYFPIDEAWRFDARFEPSEPIRQIPIANVIGLVSDTASWGAVVFEHDGESYRIDALAEPGDEELFLMFADGTSGEETYGAGRYLYVDAPDEEGRVDLDFNRAYNPPCVFTPYATCPLPPRQNRLTLRIEAGEKNYAGAKKP